MRNRGQVVAAIMQMRRKKPKDDDEYEALTNLILYVEALEQDQQSWQPRRDVSVLKVERLRLVNALQDIQYRTETIEDARTAAGNAIARMERGMEKL